MHGPLQSSSLLSRLRGTFTEPYDECSAPTHADGTCPSGSSPVSSVINSNSSSTLINSQVPVNNQSSSLPCTVSKRPQKLNNHEDSASSHSLVQTTAAAARSTTNSKISNGNDDESLSAYKQQKKQSVKSSNTQSRRQQKKSEVKEPIRTISRDSSSSCNNGFTTGATVENSDIERK